MALSHFNKESTSWSTLISWICHPVKRMQLRCNYVQESSLIDFFPFKSLKTFVAFLIVYSKVVPIAEVPLCEMEERRGRDECVCNVFAFVFLHPSPFLSEQFHFHVSDLCREIGESLLMGYFFCSPHEQQHVKIKIKTKPKCLPGKQIRSCGNIGKKRAFPSRHSKLINIQASWIWCASSHLKTLGCNLNVYLFKPEYFTLETHWIIPV